MLCATSCAPLVVSECVWSRQIVLADADIASLTDDGVREIAAHNRKVKLFCR